jgi:manganese transport protein
MTSDKKLMGDFSNPLWLKLVAAGITALIIVLNIRLLWDFLQGN